MNWQHLFTGLVITGWVIWVEYRLWANLRIHEETIRRTERKHGSGSLHAVEK
jgi:hypothetical protein